MEIENRKISELKPYANNPRHNEDAIEAVAASIKEFGFKNPVIIDKNDVIIAGHTRVSAAKRLNLKEVPTIKAEDLNEEQVRAFRLADNRVAEIATWDAAKLEQELDNILDINMEDFGFEIEDDEYAGYEDDEGYFGDERERTFSAYNLADFDEDDCEGFYQMPKLYPCDTVPDDIRSFNYMMSATETNFGIHFYCDDYQFERVWNRPEMYLPKMRDFQCMFTPDFSLYLDMPMAMKIWNVFRSRLIGQMMQRDGLEVIPTVSWAEKETFSFCFDGLPKDATLSISTIGVKQDKTATKIWRDGVDEMMKRLTPKRILIYGGKIDYDYGDAEVIYYDNITTDRMSGRA